MHTPIPVMARRIVALLGAMCASAALASPVTYTLTGVATGSVGNQSFANAPFSINVSADTANVVFNPSPRYWLVNGTTSMTIEGFGTTSLMVPTYFFNNGFGCGLGRTNGPTDILDVFAPGLMNYALDTNFGPVASTAIGMNWTEVPVTSGLGTIVLTSASNVTFRAVVPAPGGAGVIAMAGLAASRRRRSAQSAS